LTPDPATGFGFVVKGGHAPPQAPLQVLEVPVSAANRYSVRPLLSTRNLPSFAVVRSTAVPLAAAGATGAGAPYAPDAPELDDAPELELVVLELPPHPATATATAATPTKDSNAVLRFLNMVVISYSSSRISIPLPMRAEPVRLLRR
jgi:hypothetical protein